MEMSCTRKLLDMDSFCLRQFNNVTYSGTQFLDITPEEFLHRVNQLYTAENTRNTYDLKDGYASFCKHLFLPNFTQATAGTVALTPNLYPYIESGYIARQPQELPVLTRWITRKNYLACTGSDALPPAKYLDIILYTKAQLKKEAESMKTKKENGVGLRIDHQQEEKLKHDDDEDGYSIIAIKAQNVPFELPMLPITMMRNCLISEGGSGVEIHRESYQKSVDYWSKNCELK